ncbi:hypothetical protein [Stutzerimonas stutzeri]|uniref:Uncharacterized protein n=1 Tax=Stutzerimonas stutzeri KOS6 TaxID=1218352 RepID=A0A061JWT5_STUST|nr:hypothetical protein [Stutzerimonas stutzeri]EWC43379.1 hypothetical protein B597_001870 [Stutzerimonas stutzeri KOS6]
MDHELRQTRSLKHLSQLVEAFEYTGAPTLPLKGCQFVLQLKLQQPAISGFYGLRFLDYASGDIAPQIGLFD